MGLLFWSLHTSSLSSFLITRVFPDQHVHEGKVGQVPPVRVPHRASSRVTEPLWSGDVLPADANLIMRSTFQPTMERLLAETFPAFHIAVSWEAIDWGQYRHILVTGPQRSGTTFFAAALAMRLGMTHIDEDGCVRLYDRRGRPFMSRGRYDDSFLHSNESIVAQRPALSAQVHRMRLLGDQDAVVFVARFCPDVFRSQNSIMVDGSIHHNTIDNASRVDTGWTCRFGRREEWLSYWARPELRSFFTPTDSLCKIKQDVWMKYQRHVLGARALTVAYDSLSTFPAAHNAVHAKGDMGGFERQYKVGGLHAAPAKDRRHACVAPAAG